MQRFNLIDILRGGAALLVVCYHVIAYREWPGYVGTGVAKLPSIGWIGVDLFFVISGFVIGKTALEGYRSGEGWWHLYLKRRVRRIAPLYILTLVIYLLFINFDILRQGWFTVFNISSHLFFVHNFWHGTHGSINPPNWSIALEMQFYILMIFCVPWIAKSSVWKILSVWISIAIFWKFGTTLVLPPGESNPMLQFIYASQLPGVLDEFGFGVCLAKLLEMRLLSISRLHLGIAVCFSILFLTIAWVTLDTEVNYWKSTVTIVLWRTIICAGFASMLAVIVMIPHDGGWLTRPLRYIGEISYGIYLWHLPVLMVLLSKTTWQGIQLLSSTIAVTVALASLSWHGFEKLWITKKELSAQP